LVLTGAAAPGALAPGLYTDLPDAFYAPAVSAAGVTALGPGLYTDLPDTFYAPTVAGGTVTSAAHVIIRRTAQGRTRRLVLAGAAAPAALAPSLYADPDTFFAPVIGGGAVTPSTGIIIRRTAQGRTRRLVLARAAAPGAVNPGLYVDPDAFYAPVAGAGAVNLGPGLYSDPDAFFAPVVAAGAVNLAPGLYADPDVFFVPAIGRGAVTLAPLLYSDPDAFFAPTLGRGAVSLAPNLYSDPDAFFAPAAAPGAAPLSPGLYTDPDVFYSPAVSAAGVTALGPSLYVDPDSFFPPATAPGAVNLAPNLYIDPDAFLVPTVAVAAVIGLTPGLYADPDTFFAPAAIGATNLAPGLYIDPDTFFAPTAATGATNLAPGLYADPDSFFAPAIGAGAVNVAPGLYSDPDAFFAPVVSVAGIVNLAPIRYSDPDVFFAPAIGRGAVPLAPGLYADPDTFFGPIAAAGANTLGPGLYADPDIFFAPAAAPGAVNVAPGFYIDPDAFFAPVVSVAGIVNLAPVLYSDPDVFFGPAAGLGARALAPGRYTDPDAFFAPVLVNLPNLRPSLYLDPDVFFAPAFAPGTANLAPALYVDPDAFFAPIVIGVVIPPIEPPIPPPARPVVVTLEQYLNLITAEHNQRPRYMATVALSIAPYLDGENLAFNLIGLFDLDTAVGQQLDMLGEWVGITRFISAPLNEWFALDVRNEGFDQGRWISPFESSTQVITLDDDHYRLLLRAKIVANQWDGTIPGAYEAWNTLFAGTGYQILIQDGLPRGEYDFAFDGQAGGFDRSAWFQKSAIEAIYFSLDDPALGFDAGYWLGAPGTAILQPRARDHGNMHLIEALLGPPLDAVTLALFTGGYLGLKSAGVQIDYVTQVQPPVPPDMDNSGTGIGLPLFAFDVGPGDLGWWMSFDNAEAGLDDAPLFYPGGHPVDPNFVPPLLTFDGDAAHGIDAGWWTPAVRPDYLVFDSPNPVNGLDAANWYTPGSSWWDGTSSPPPPDPDEALPPTGVTFPPTALAGFDLGAWAAAVVTRFA
jgi:hypothetical protein